MPVKQQPVKRVTNEALFALINDRVLPEIAAVKQEVAELKKETGLNGHTVLLKAFLDREAKRIDSRKSYANVGADIRSRLSFLAVPRSWLRALFYAAIGGLGWKLVSQLPPIHF